MGHLFEYLKSLFDGVDPLFYKKLAVTSIVGPWFDKKAL
jgi:hypothetical protein